MNSLTFISFINNQFLTMRSVINAESFFFIIKLINNYELNKESIFFKSQTILKDRMMLLFNNNI